MLSKLETEDGFIRLTENDQEVTQSSWISLPNKVQVKLCARGVLEIKPQNPSDSSIIFSAAIHGNETAPIEMVSQLIARIVTGKLHPKVHLLFILGNYQSMKIGERFVAINMNRLFSDAYKEYSVDEKNHYELQRAMELQEQVSSFYLTHNTKDKYHFDLHTAIKPSLHKTFAIRPKSATRISTHEKSMLANMGIEAVLQHNKPSTTFSAYSVQAFSARAYTLELGKVKPFGENNPEDFAAATDTFAALIEAKPLARASAKKVIEYKVVAEIIRQSEAFKFHVAENVLNFTPYPQGYLLAEDTDYNYRVAFKQEAVVFPNINVPVGQRVAVMVTTVDDDN